MARKSKAEKAKDALEAENALNTTRNNILVRPGQIWTDLNPRAKAGRMISVSSVKAGKAVVRDGHRTSTVSVSRMYPHARGYEIYGRP